MIAVVASASSPDPEKFHRGEQTLIELGFQPDVQKDLVARQRRYTAGTAEERIGEFQKAWQSDAPTVWAARGGYGTMHLLPALESVIAQRSPKLFIGFSDFTALGCLLWKHGIPWIHGPLFTTLAAEPTESREHLLAVASGKASGRIVRGKAGRLGHAHGRLIGGSLALLAALCGTPFFPDLSGAIVFLEDLGEQPYRIDRMFTQLRLSGAFSGAVGLALGDFAQCEPKDGGYTCAEVLSDLAEQIGLPTVTGLPFGHLSPNFALPFGGEAELDGNRGTLTLTSEIVG